MQLTRRVKDAQLAGQRRVKGTLVRKTERAVPPDTAADAVHLPDDGGRLAHAAPLKFGANAVLCGRERDLLRIALPLRDTQGILCQFHAHMPASLSNAVTNSCKSRAVDSSKTSPRVSVHVRPL